LKGVRNIRTPFFMTSPNFCPISG